MKQDKRKKNDERVMRELSEMTQDPEPFKPRKPVWQPKLGDLFNLQSTKEKK
jgi:hypothetical protein